MNYEKKTFRLSWEYPSRRLQVNAVVVSAIDVPTALSRTGT